MMYNHEPSNPIALVGHRQRSRKNHEALVAELSDAGNPARVLKLFIKREHGVMMKSEDIRNLLWRRGLAEKRDIHSQALEMVLENLQKAREYLKPSRREDVTPFTHSAVLANSDNTENCCCDDCVCNDDYTACMGLPCYHNIMSILETGSVLKTTDFDFNLRLVLLQTVTGTFPEGWPDTASRDRVCPT
ncbi:hypothetical protein E4U59_002925 [Claviceps monticola]|nr:hypothetical protein E4U59_002925 [Claviceps monticola]